MLFIHVDYAFSLLLQADEPEHKKYKSRDGSVKKVSAVIQLRLQQTYPAVPLFTVACSELKRGSKLKELQLIYASWYCISPTSTDIL